MPDPAQRKQRESSQKRSEEKYLLCPDEHNPQKVYPVLIKETEILRSVMNTKNYIKLLTQLDINQFIMAQYYIYCDEDLWISGEGMVFNINPDKKILVRVICSKAKKECICYDENSNHFLTCCPSCKYIVGMIKNTDFKCEHCGFELPYTATAKMPYAKLSCELCPREIGWEATQDIKDIILIRLKPRPEKLSEELDKIFKE